MTPRALVSRIESMAQAKTIEAAVGERLRDWRTDAGLTQDEVATAARELGFEWRQATVAAIEAGRRDVSLGEFFALPFLVQRLGPEAGGGAFRRLPFFVVVKDEHVALAPDVVCYRPHEHLRRLLEGKFVPQGVPADAVKPRRGIRRKLPERVEGTMEAELKAARRLGVDPIQVRFTGLKLWGRSLTSERESRVERKAKKEASRRSLQALRGHVTRQLLDELREALPERKEAQ